MIDQGAIIDYVASFQAGGLFRRSPEDIVSEVASALATHGFPIRKQPVLTKPSLSEIASAEVTLQKYTSTVQIEFQNQTGLSYAGPQDVASIVDHEFFVATDELPISSSIPSFRNPGQSTVDTGQPGAPVPSRPCTDCKDKDCDRGVFASIECTLSGFFGGLTQTAFGVIALVLIAVLVGLAIIRKELPGIIRPA